MAQMAERYINPLTDFGFKRLFGSEFNKELLISFLNTLLDGDQDIPETLCVELKRAGHIEVRYKNEAFETITIDIENSFTGYRIHKGQGNILDINISKFDKTEQELETMFDKWMFVLKNLSRLMERPTALQERVFTRLFQQAEIVELNTDG